jgi:membrane protein
MNAKVLLTYLRQSLNDWNEDNGPRLGAALAFYTILSISPLVILAIAIVSLIFDRSRVQSHLLAEVQSMVGAPGGMQ